MILICASARAIKQSPSRAVSDHPETVLIKTESAPQKPVYCCGALVAPNVVLTAAHCVKGFDKWEVLAPYAKGAPVTVGCKRAMVYPKFRTGSFENDIAVLILDGKIAIGRAFPTLYHGELLRIDTKLVVVGRVDNGAVSPTRAFQTLATVVQFPGNVNVYGGHPNVTEHGDSGGPVFVSGKEKEIVAVISGGIQGSQFNVSTDCYSPINRKNRGWILEQVSKVRMPD